ncbi:MAG: hypothetical protein RJA22_1738 [Verrucomicrobiota bacterium]
MNAKMKSSLMLVMLGCLLAPSLKAAVGFSYGSSGWKYRLGTSESSSPTNAWRAIIFNDSTWNANATGPIGYDTAGNPGTSLPIATVTPTSADGGFLSIYYRKAFVVPDPAAILTATLDAVADDGLVVWVNGTEVGRANVPLGELGYSSVANAATTPEVNGISTNIASLLVAGTNVIAIHAFNVNSTSSDLVMDAALSVTEDGPPVVLSTFPAANGTVTSLSFVNVTFDKSVSGVDVTDLTVNGAAATNFQAISAREFQWQVATPATGAVNIVLASGGITDTVGVPSPFAGTNWTCTFNPNAAPTGARITEFLADNERGIEDEDGSRSDWIEIYNPGPLDLNLLNWSLTDTPTNLTRWRFPSLNLSAGKYLVVMASGKNRTDPTGPYLHTDFTLSRNGSYLALVDPGQNVISKFDPAYPPQDPDISYGLDGVDPLLKGYFLVPTPGSNNLASGAFLAPEPQFSLKGGVYTDASLTLTLTAEAGLTIRYTFDGTEPTGTSPGGASPVNISFSTNMMIKARAYSATAGVWPSKVVSRKFIMLDSSTAGFSSDIPIVVFSTQGRTIPQNLAPGSARPRGQLLAIDTYRGRAALTGPIDTHEFSAHEIVGQTSAGFPKQPQRVEINSDLGEDKDVSLLGLPAEADWNFRNPYSDKCLMNDFLGYELWEDMGNYSCRRRLVELFIDTGGGKLSYPGDYYGVMTLFERIERGKDRVNISELTRFATNEPAISGGYIVKKDKDSTGDVAFNTAGGSGFVAQTLKMHEPKPTAVTTPQLNWIRNYLVLMEGALYAANWTNATGTNHYSYYMDVDAFVDQHHHVEFTRQIDGYRLSSYYSKDRNGKFGPKPVWDWNLSFGNANYGNGGYTNGWYFGEGTDVVHPWQRRLIFGGTAASGTGGDPDYRQKITDRWAVLRTNALNGPRIAARIDQVASNLTEAAARNYTKYPVLNTYIWPNPEGSPWAVDYTQPTYPLIIAEMKKWVLGRYAWMDDQYMRAPSASIGPGAIPSGTSLTLTAPEGGIYYTTNGADPRLPGGGISPAAQSVASGGSVTLAGNARLFARAYNAATLRWTRWSPPLENTYVVRTNRFVITEIMYAPPAPPAGSPYTAEDFEYIELRNVDGGPLSVAGSRLSGGINFTFPALTLAAGQRVLVVRNLAAFATRYSTNGLLIAGEYTGSLANEGNRLQLNGPVGETLLDFAYNNSWYPVTDGFGFSLAVNDDAAPLASWGLASSWRPSGSLAGTPGADNGAAVTFPPVVINEVLSHSDVPPPTDTIELHNLSGSPANIGGWLLTDDRNTPRKFRIPNGTTIPANGYLTFTEADFNSGANGNIPFALSALGDEVYLFSADAATNLTGYLHGFAFGAQADLVTFGRYQISSGEERFVAQSASTLGGANAGPLVGPVVISEINYHPVDVVNAYGAFDNTEDEYIELRNISGAPVPLYDPAYPTNAWRLRDAVDFTFPAGTSIPAGGYALVVSFDPANATALAAFRANNGVPPSVPVYGPYSGQLDNSADGVELARPDAPVPGTVPYLLVDKVSYTDTAPWPAAADGIGLSLQRTVESSYGNDPTNWVAGGRSPGASYVPGPVPVITQQPADASALATTPVSLSVRATGTPPLSFQWRFRPLGGASFAPIQGASSSNLNFAAVQLSDAGSYDCIVANTAGAVTSSNATLTVGVPANIVSHPTNVSVRIPPDPQAIATRTAVFRVSATTGNPPLSFQWQRNGTNLPAGLPTYSGVTSNTLTITNVVASDAGTYRCAITDGAGTVYCSNAVLLTLVSPVIIQSPQSQSILQGDPITFTVRVTNVSTGPFNYVWRYGSAILVSNYNVAEYFNVLTVTNVPLASSNVNRYRCDVQSPATVGQGTASGVAFITVLADFDRDRMWDNWEVLYGFNTNDASDAGLDLDGDLMANAKEYGAGTDPLDPASVLKVTGFTFGAQNTFNFLAISNRSYSVQAGASLPDGPWLSVTNVTAVPTNRTVEVTTPPLPAPRYLRVVTPAQP